MTRTSSAREMSYECVFNHHMCRILNEMTVNGASLFDKNGLECIFCTNPYNEYPNKQVTFDQRTKF